MKFVKEFNIGFGYPRTDTCSTCDYQEASVNSITDQKSKNELEELKKHQELAQACRIGCFS